MTAGGALWCGCAVLNPSDYLQAEKSSREAAAEAEARTARLEAKTRSQAEDLEAAAEKVAARSVAA